MRAPKLIALESTRKRVLAFHFSPNAKTFHIVVKMKDVPGATSNVLGMLSQRVDLIGSTSYSLDDGSAIWSGFVRSLRHGETAKSLEGVLASSPVVREYLVAASDKGLLVDSYHSGVETGPGRPAALMPLAGFTHMFERLVRDFGSGGETILFEEGSALGKSSGEYLKSHMGAGSLDWKTRALVSMFRSIGYGSPTLKVLEGERKYSIVFRDCFECSSAPGKRKECGFFRGQLAATISTLAGEQFTSQEVKCRLRGDPYCEFRVNAKD